jgi:hypothetical protein
VNEEHLITTSLVERVPKQKKEHREKGLFNVWAADFETQAGSSTFFFFFGRFDRNEQYIKFACWRFEVYRSHSTCVFLFIIILKMIILTPLKKQGN